MRSNSCKLEWTLYVQITCHPPCVPKTIPFMPVKNSPPPTQARLRKARLENEYTRQGEMRAKSRFYGRIATRKLFGVLSEQKLPRPHTFPGYLISPC